MGTKITILFEQTKKQDKTNETTVQDTGHQQVKKKWSLRWETRKYALHLSQLTVLIESSGFDADKRNLGKLFQMKRQSSQSKESKKY